MMMADPEMMEVLQVILGGFGGAPGADGDDAMDEDMPSFTPPPAREQYKPKAAPEPVLSPEEQAIKDKKALATAAKDRGNALYKDKKFIEAIEAYDEAISIDETNILYLSNKAAVYIEMGDCVKAIALCEEALELGKIHRVSYEDKAKVYQRIASAHVKQNDLKTAIVFYNKAQMEQFDKATERKIKTLELEFRKQEVDAYVNPELGLEAKEKGNAAYREGKYGEAVHAYEDAIKRDPKSAAYRNNLAAALQKIGDFNGAKTQVLFAYI